MPSCTRRKYQVGESTEPHQAKNGLVRVDFNPRMLTGVKGFQQRLNLCHHSDKGLVMKAWRIAFIANLTDLTHLSRTPLEGGADGRGNTHCIEL